MIRVALFLFVLSASALQVAALQPDPRPTERYHEGAKAFIDGDNAAALAAVEAGLAVAPNDPRLTALRDLIQQQQQEQDQQDGGQQDDAQNSDPGDEGDEGDSSDQGSDPPPGDDGQEAEADQTNTGDQDPTEAGQAPPSMGEPGQMTEAQAQRLLDAVGGEEELLLRQLRRAPTQARRTDKDW